MNTLTKVAVGIVAAGLLAMYGIYLYLWLHETEFSSSLEAVAIHHAIAIFLLAVLYLVGLGIWKAVAR
jgi:hypothetical protein